MASSQNYEPLGGGDACEINKWKFRTVKTHISDAQELERISNEVNIPLPEMLFGGNLLSLEYENGFKLQFKSVDALNLVDKTKVTMKVEYADDWQKYRESKGDQEEINNIVKPFDWTYTTDYKGTLSSSTQDFTITATEERINLDLLKVQERILFYDDVILHEDELGDNGICELRVKIRVMPSGFFVLLKMFLRIDGVLFKTHSTRLHHLFVNDYITREYQVKEKTATALKKVCYSHVLSLEVVEPFLESTHLSVDKIHF
eukprot:Awhi_evm2s15099